MQVDGDLISLPANGNDLPLPLHCRAPLGLTSGSVVHVALVTAARDDNSLPSAGPRRPHVLVASVLDPQLWDQTFWITFEGPDRVGILFTILACIRDWNERRAGSPTNEGALTERLNVVLGESVTRPDASKPAWLHDVCLLVQPESIIPNARAYTKEALQNILKGLSGEGTEVNVREYQAPGRLVRWLGSFQVDRGVVRLRDSWSELRDELANSTADAGDFDFNCAAYSADLHMRAIRVMFPKRGAKRIVFVHRDIPNAFWQIARELCKENHSILTTHLRAGGAGEKTNTIVAACEPLDPIEPRDWDASASKLTSVLKELATATGPGVKIEVRRPIPYERTLFLERKRKVEELLDDAEALLSHCNRSTREACLSRLIDVSAKSMRSLPEYVRKNCSAITFELVQNVLEALSMAKDDRAAIARAAVIRAVAGNRSYANNFIQCVERDTTRHDRTKDGIPVMLATTGAIDPRALEYVRAALTRGTAHVRNASASPNLQELRCELDSCSACCIVIGNPDGEGNDERKFSFLDLLSLAQDLRNHVHMLVAFDSAAYAFPTASSRRDNVRFAGFNIGVALRPPPPKNATHADNTRWFDEFHAGRSLPAVVYEWMKDSKILRPVGDSSETHDSND